MTGNRAGHSHGLGQIELGGTSRFLRCNMSDNAAVQYDVGLLRLYGNDVYFEDCQMNGITAGRDYGVMYSSKHENVAPSLNFLRCEMNNNYAGRDYGVFGVNSGYVYVVDVNMTGNRATNNVGVFSVVGPGLVHFNNVVMTDNRAGM